ncbi:MAG TPA: hypothetical protein VM367_04570 [Pseudonocardia sp.]|nr:hypothetical protein [Pseudonocardia sp.]
MPQTTPPPGSSEGSADGGNLGDGAVVGQDPGTGGGDDPADDPDPSDDPRPGSTTPTTKPTPKPTPTPTIPTTTPAPAPILVGRVAIDGADAADLYLLPTIEGLPGAPPAGGVGLWWFESETPPPSVVIVDAGHPAFPPAMQSHVLVLSVAGAPPRTVTFGPPQPATVMPEALSQLLTASTATDVLLIAQTDGSFQVWEPTPNT